MNYDKQQRRKQWQEEGVKPSHLMIERVPEHDGLPRYSKYVPREKAIRLVEGALIPDLSGKISVEKTTTREYRYVDGD